MTISFFNIICTCVLTSDISGCFAAEFIIDCHTRFTIVHNEEGG